MKKILVVEDRPDCLNWAMKALKGKVTVELAMNLVQATAALNKGGIDGIICDICFHEQGVSIRGPFFGEGEVIDKNSGVELIIKLFAKQDRYGNDLAPDRWFEPEVIALMRETMRDSEVIIDEYRNLNCLGKTCEELRRIVVGENVIVAGDVRDHHNHCLGDCIERYNRSTDTGLVPTASIPALGHVLIKRCLEQCLPVSFLSSTRHASHSLTVPVATGLITLSEYNNGRFEAKNSTTGVDIRTPKGIFTGDYYKTEGYWLECLKMLQIVT